MYKIFTGLFIGVIIIADMLFFYFYKKMGLSIQDFLTIISISILIITALIAFYQLKANHEWNRRHSALSQMIQLRPILSRSIIFLNKNISYTELNNTLSLNEIHHTLCDGDDHTKNPDITEQGKQIKHHIFIILNHYEFLAIGVKNNVYDECLIKNSIRGSLIKAYNVFCQYIEHLRTEKHSNNKNLFIELERLANKWKDEGKKRSKKRGQTD